MTTNNEPSDEVLRAVLDYADQRVMAVHGRASKDDVGQAWLGVKDALSNHYQPAMPADAEDAARWRWLWNHAHNVSFNYRVSSFTQLSVTGLHCNTLKVMVDTARHRIEGES